MWAKDQGEINKCKEKFQKAAHLLPFVLAPSLREGLEVAGDTSVSDTVVYELPDQTPSKQPFPLIDAPHDWTQSHTIPRKPVPSQNQEPGPAKLDSSTSTHGFLLSSEPAAELGIGNQTSSWLWFPASSASVSQSERTRRAITFSAPKLQPLDLIENRAKHNVDEAVHQRFLAGAASLDPDPNTEAWINIATWWLLKSQKVWSILMDSGNPKPEESNIANVDRWDNNTSIFQA
jgi:hypothetical protein